MSRLSRSGGIAFSPDFQFLVDPDFNGGDGLYSGGFSALAKTLAAKTVSDGLRPCPMFTQQYLYGLGITPSPPIAGGESFQNDSEARVVPRTAYSTAGTLMRPPRTILVSQPQSLTGGQFTTAEIYDSLLSRSDDIDRIGALVSVVATAGNLIGLGLASFEYPTVRWFPRSGAEILNWGTDTAANELPNYLRPSASRFYGGEVLVFGCNDPSFVAAAGAPIGFINATRNDGFGPPNTDGIAEYAQFTQTIRVPVDPDINGERFFYWACNAAYLGDANAYAAACAAACDRYRAVILVRSESDVSDDLNPLLSEIGATVIPADGSAGTLVQYDGTDPDEFVGYILDEAEGFFSTDTS